MWKVLKRKEIVGIAVGHFKEKESKFKFNLLYVFPCVILFLCFSVLLVLRLPRLGKRELI